MAVGVVHLPWLEAMPDSNKPTSALRRCTRRGLFALQTKPPWWGRGGLWAFAGMLFILTATMSWTLLIASTQTVNYPFSRSSPMALGSSMQRAPDYVSHVHDPLHVQRNSRRNRVRVHRGCVCRDGRSISTQRTYSRRRQSPANTRQPANPPGHVPRIRRYLRGRSSHGSKSPGGHHQRPVVYFPKALWLPHARTWLPLASCSSFPEPSWALSAFTCSSGTSAAPHSALGLPVLRVFADRARSTHLPRVRPGPADRPRRIASSWQSPQLHRLHHRRTHIRRAHRDRHPAASALDLAVGRPLAPGNDRARVPHAPPRRCRAPAMKAATGFLTLFLM